MLTNFNHSLIAKPFNFLLSSTLNDDNYCLNRYIQL